jgi:hypothetical protein
LLSSKPEQGKGEFRLSFLVLNYILKQKLNPVEKKGVVYTATGIDDITTTASDTDLRFVGGSGSLQMISGKDQIVTIYSVSGILNQRVELKSGESQTINLVPGIYVVNGQKVVIH